MSSLPEIQRQNISVIRQSIGLSLALKALLLLLTLAGHASPWVALAADAGASFLVIFNGLRSLGTVQDCAAVISKP